jgi:ketosteroid isomerase-like protein
MIASPSDEAAVRKIIQDEGIAWNKGDAEAHARYFATDGTFTNLLGMFFTGHEAYLERHDQIFKTVYRGTSKAVLPNFLGSTGFSRCAWKPASRVAARSSYELQP